MHSEFLIILFVIISIIAISALIYLYFGHYLRIVREENNIKLKIDEIVDHKVKERTRQLEDMRDSISNFAVQRFELARELELKNIRVLEQKDLTDKQSEKLHEAYEEIKRLGSFRQQMVQMMIHDLKNPLNVILNLTDTEAMPAKPRSIIRQISYEMLDLILNLLEVHKFEEMKMKVENENIHLNSLVKILTDKLGLLFVNYSIGLRTSVPADCWINADRHIVNRILTNLLSNAIKYTPSGGEIQIIATRKNEDILLEIKDNGSGIPEDNIDSLFEMYKHGQNMEVMDNGSTGIGLTYCRLAVETLGGKIGIKSEVGKGTSVWFTLNPGKVSENVVYEDITENIEIKISKLNLTPEDINILRPYAEDLKSINICEITKIMALTSKINCSDNDRIMRWKDSVEETLFTANEKRYLELVDII
jgi:signal transduction histidine kinase